MKAAPNWQECTTAAGGRRISYVKRPGAGTILFLHGLYGDHTHFVDAFNSPALADRALVAIDLPGFGTSDMPPDGAILERFVDAARAVLDENGRPAVVVAHSMSSSVACRLLDRAGGLVLIEGNIVPAHLQISDRIVRLSRTAYESEFARLSVKAEMMLKWETRLADAETRRYFAQSYRRCRVDAAWSAAHAVNADVRANGVLDTLQRSSRPLTVIYGASSSFAATVGLLRSEMPQARFVEIAAAGHFTMLDQPDALYGAIGEFVRSTLLPC